MAAGAASRKDKRKDKRAASQDEGGVCGKNRIIIGTVVILVAAAGSFAVVFFGLFNVSICKQISQAMAEGRRDVLKNFDVSEINECARPSDCSFDASTCQLPCPLGYQTDKNRCSISCECALTSRGTFQGDIQFDDAEAVSLLMRYGHTSIKETFAVFSGSVRESVILWPKAPDGRVKVPYFITEELVTETSLIEEAIAIYAKETCVDFVRRTGEHEYVNFVREVGCWSRVGRSDGPQKLSLADSCLTLGILLHEMMHVIGFDHEHVRPDRDGFIAILRGNIIPDQHMNFAKIREPVKMLGSPYDLTSVTHISSRAWINRANVHSFIKHDGDPIIGQRDRLSRQDKQEINILYQCPNPNPKIPQGIVGPGGPLGPGAVPTNIPRPVPGVPGGPLGPGAVPTNIPRPVPGVPSTKSPVPDPPPPSPAPPVPDLTPPSPAPPVPDLTPPSPAPPVPDLPPPSPAPPVPSLPPPSPAPPVPSLPPPSPATPVPSLPPPSPATPVPSLPPPSPTPPVPSLPPPSPATPVPSLPPPSPAPPVPGLPSPSTESPGGAPVPGLPPPSTESPGGPPVPDQPSTESPGGTGAPGGLDQLSPSTELPGPGKKDEWYWASWGPYSSCLETCGLSWSYRHRRCVNDLIAPEGIGRWICEPGSWIDQTECTRDPCRGVVGVWAEWLSWSTCTATCGIGFRSRQRICDDDEKCNGYAFDSGPCPNEPCPTISRRRRDTATEIQSDADRRKP